MTRFDDIPVSLRVQAVELFVSGAGAKDVARWFMKEHGIKVSRERVYDPIVKWAKEQGYLRVLPGPHRELQKQLASHFKQDPRRLHVVNTGGSFIRHHVAVSAAELVLGLIKQIGETRGGIVRIGLGGGRTVREVCQELAVFLRSENKLPHLGFQPISSGFDVADPTSAPITFLNFFQEDEIRTKIETVGLFAQALVKTAQYAEVMGAHGVKESVKAAKAIDIVLTSCASASDRHGALRRFERIAKQEEFRSKELDKAGWKADLQYIPYGDDGPIDFDAGVRAVTLFELEGLKKLVRRKHGHVVVIAPPCGGCNTPKTAAVRPLLGCKSLKGVWSHLVTDISTAEAVLSAAA